MGGGAGSGQQQQQQQQQQHNVRAHGVGGEPNLVVAHDVHGAGSVVVGQEAQLHGLVDHTLHRKTHTQKHGHETSSPALAHTNATEPCTPKTTRSQQPRDTPGQQRQRLRG